MNESYLRGFEIGGQFTDNIGVGQLELHSQSVELILKGLLNLQR